MLIPLTRKKFEELVPLVATAEQYRYSWGKLSDVLRRVLISAAGVLLAILLQTVLPKGFEIVEFTLGIGMGLYWLWSPTFWASRRNAALRKYQYSGFWRGKVLDVFITEDLIGEEETVNERGELVVIENRERRLNLEVGDETGFLAELQVPLKRDHRMIRPGDVAEMLVMSNRPDLSRIFQVSDIFLPDYNLWVSDYPYIRRDLYGDVRRQLTQGGKQRPKRRSP
jgi:hypothetical protein